MQHKCRREHELRVSWALSLVLSSCQWEGETLTSLNCTDEEQEMERRFKQSDASRSETISELPVVLSADTRRIRHREPPPPPPPAARPSPADVVCSPAV
ncbi:hypothetical protein INR49_011596 [Caranx melampygus]|nr:hypothetical protein INR49_011596 [Caranx melampygus]